MGWKNLRGEGCTTAGQGKACPGNTPAGHPPASCRWHGWGASPAVHSCMHAMPAVCPLTPPAPLQLAIVRDLAAEANGGTSQSAPFSPPVGTPLAVDTLIPLEDAAAERTQGHATSADGAAGPLLP